MSFRIIQSDIRTHINKKKFKLYLVNSLIQREMTFKKIYTFHNVLLRWNINTPKYLVYGSKNSLFKFLI